MSSDLVHRGGAWVVSQSILLAAVVALGVAFRGGGLPGVVAALGFVLFVAGGGVGIAGVVALGRHRTAFPKPREHSVLVQHGIYRRVRHPLYTSVMLASTGWSLVWESWPALVVALGLIPFFVAKARREECWLREKFPEYPSYASEVPPFIPRLSRRRRCGSGT